MIQLLPRHIVHSNCEAKLLLSGTHFFTRVEQVIKSAQQYLHLQFYIFDEDKTGRHYLNLLMQAAQRGVKVMLVVDGYASDKLSVQTIRHIKSSGIIFKQFSPIKNKHFRVGRRLHHKVVLADRKIALVGGINISDKYSGFNGQEPWLDFAVEVSGKIVKDIERVCEATWRKKIVKKHIRSMTNLPVSSGKMRLRLSQNDWWRRRIEISNSYRQVLRKSQSELIIVASYFLPGSSLRRLIKNACNRGVKIKILLVGYSDVMMIKPAMRFLYEWMLKHNIEIYEWNKSILHGKLAIADRKWVTVGSYNLNALSDYGSLELNVEVFDKQFATDTTNLIEQLIASGSDKITYPVFRKQSTLILYAYRWLCYQLVRIALRLLFILMYRDKIKA